MQPNAHNGDRLSTHLDPAPDTVGLEIRTKTTSSWFEDDTVRVWLPQGRRMHIREYPLFALDQGVLTMTLKGDYPVLPLYPISARILDLIPANGALVYDLNRVTCRVYYAANSDRSMPPFTTVVSSNESVGSRDSAGSRFLPKIEVESYECF